MMTTLSFGLRALVAAVVLVAVLHPDGGAIYRGGLATPGLALIGLGLFLELRKPRVKPAAAIIA